MIFNTQIAGGGVTPSGSLSITTNGTYDVTDYASANVNVSSSIPSMSDPIRFFDYDGTLVASYRSVPVSLPSIPSHTGLTSGTWNHTRVEIKSQFDSKGMCDVGANYTTSSGATEIDIELHTGRLHPYLSLAVLGTVSIYWGDGSAADTYTGTNLNARMSDIHHEYMTAGKYTITISMVSGTGYALRSTTSYTLLNNNSSSPDPNRVYANAVKSVRVGANCTIGDYAFCYCYSLVSVSIPSTIASFGTYAFEYCVSLTHITIPANVSSLSNYAFIYCYSLASVSMPSTLVTLGNYVFQHCYSLNTVILPHVLTSIGTYAFGSCLALETIAFSSYLTSIGNYAFSGCYSLASISIPSSVTSLGSNVFDNCSSLSSITIPAGISEIKASTFKNCYGMAAYHFKRTASVPTLANNVFTNIQSDCKIYVPSSKLNDYKTASNWSTYASYIVGE